MSDIDPRYSDKRTAERYLRMGLLEEKAWEKHLKALPDLAEKASRIEATLADEDLDDETDDDAEE